jgi:nucleotide-binding universal stress UspA family protein
MADPPSQKIVVGLDGSQQSLTALRWAIRRAASSDSVLDVVHCWQSRPAVEVLFGSRDELSRGSVCMLQNEVVAALAALPDLPTRPRIHQVSRQGRTAAILTEQAADAQLLVLGAHSRTDTRDLVFGRVASSCLRHSACPVVIVENEHTVLRHDVGTQRSVPAS